MEAPREVQELRERIGRLQTRLQTGDADMTADEIQAAIDRAAAKLTELEAVQPAAKESAKVLSLLPKAAELYRRQITDGLDGNPRAAIKARVILRDLLGKIRLMPGADGSLWAEFQTHPAALLRGGAGTDGSGGRI